MTEEEFEEEISKMTDAELGRFADTLKSAAILAAKKKLHKLLVRKFADIEERISAQERRFRIGQYKTGISKRIVAQDFNGTEQTKKWPSLTGG